MWWFEREKLKDGCFLLSFFIGYFTVRFLSPRNGNQNSSKPNPVHSTYPRLGGEDHPHGGLPRLDVLKGGVPGQQVGRLGEGQLVGRPRTQAGRGRHLPVRTTIKQRKLNIDQCCGESETCKRCRSGYGRVSNFYKNRIRMSISCLDPQHVAIVSH